MLKPLLTASLVLIALSTAQAQDKKVQSVTFTRKALKPGDSMTIKSSFDGKLKMTMVIQGNPQDHNQEINRRQDRKIDVVGLTETGQLKRIKVRYDRIVRSLARGEGRKHPLEGRSFSVERNGDNIDVSSDGPLEESEKSQVKRMEEDLLKEQGNGLGQGLPKTLKVGDSVKIPEDLLRRVMDMKGQDFLFKTAKMKLSGTRKQDGVEVAVFKVEVKIESKPDARQQMKVEGGGEVLIEVATSRQRHFKLEAKITMEMNQGPNMPSMDASGNLTVIEATTYSKAKKE